MEKLSEVSKFGMADNVTAEVVRGGKVLTKDKDDKSDKPKGVQNE